MDVAQLRTLIRVAELGSLSKAADRLCIAQPALSRHVRLLEEELGTRLFDRHGRGMTVTEQGRVVLQHALRIMNEFDDIKASLTEENETLRGSVSIGMTPTVAEILSVPLLAVFRRSHPQATFRIISAYSLYLLEWVHAGSLDIAVLYDPISIRSLKSEPLIEEALYAVAPTSAGLSLETAVDFRTLKDESLVLPSGVHSLRQILDRAADECGIRLETKVEIDSYSVLKQVVLNGGGWTVLPLAAVQDDVAAGRLSAAPLVDPVPVRHVELTYPADRPTSRLGAFAGKAVSATTADLVASGTWPGRMLTRSFQARTSPVAGSIRKALDVTGS